MRSITRVRSVVLIFAAAYVAAACGGAATPTVSPAPTSSAPTAAASSAAAPATKTPTPNLGKVTIATGAHVASLWPITIADGAGFFKDEGLDANVVLTNSGSNTLAAVSGGSAQFGGLPYGDAILATEKGQPLVSVAALVNQYTTDAIISAAKAKELGITPALPLQDRIAKAKGLKIAVNAPGSGQDKLIRFVLKRYGLNADKDVQIVGLGNEGMLPALLAGQVDALLNSSPTTDQGIAGGAQWWFRPSQGEIPELSGFVYTTLIARPDFVKSNPQVAQAVVRAITRALTLLRTNEAKSLEVLAKYVKTSPELLKSSLQNNVAGYPKDAVISEQGFKQNVDFLAEFGQTVKVKFDDVTVNDYAKKAATP